MTPVEITLFLIFLYPTIIIIYSIFDPHEHEENTEALLNIFREASKINKEKNETDY